MKEAARTSILAHQWRQLWPYFSGVFNFEYSLSDKALVKRNASNFVSWVNHIVEHHLSPSIEGFRVIYALDRSSQSHVDKWVIFALTKEAKSLVLELNPICSIAHDFCTLLVECCMSLRSPSNLKTLVLKFVNVTNEVVGCFLQSCLFLEKLCICRSVCLTSVRSCGLGHALKHLEVTSCFQLENIDILAPKLMSFKCQGTRIQLHIQNACVLSELSLGVRDTASVVSAFDSPWKYFSQLELLHVKLYMERNLIAPAVATLANVKHMILIICAHTGQSFIGWVSLIEASPVLHKLSLQITRFLDTRTSSTFWHPDKVPRK